MAESYGWAGKILRVNLTTGEITTQDDEKYHKYIGGMGMAYRIMYEEAPMELDPYDEKALVIFGVGPLTGAGWCEYNSRKSYFKRGYCCV